MALVSFDQVTAGMQRCMASHPPVSQQLAKESLVLVNLFAEMFALKTMQVETDTLPQKTVDELKRWEVIL